MHRGSEEVRDDPSLLLFPSDKTGLPGAVNKAPDSSSYSSQHLSSLPGITYRRVSLLLCLSQFPIELFFKIFIGIQLTYNALLVSGV